MTDLEILRMDNLAEKVYEVFMKFKPHIENVSKRYSRQFFGRIDAEDFEMDIYEALYYYVGRVNEEKIVDIENFSYYIYVRYAIFRAFKKYEKILENETDIEIDCTESFYGSNIFGKSREINLLDYYAFKNYSDQHLLLIDLDNFYDSLTERERFVVEKRGEGVLIRNIKEMLGVSHGTIVRDIKLAKKKFEYYFVEGA